MPQKPSPALAQNKEALQGMAGVLYDELMAEIEPDLVTANIDGLEEKYKDETPAEAAARAERYNAAYEAFQKAMDERELLWADQFRRMQHEAIASTEKEDRDAEVADLEALDKTISSM
jgi:hypothetical protein